MTYLNQLLPAEDLAHLTADERDFLVRRMELTLDTDSEVRKIVAKQLQASLADLGKVKRGISEFRDHVQVQ